MTDEVYDFGLEPGESFEPDESADDFALDAPHVMTALGPVDPGALGVTLPSEHVIVQPQNDGADDPDRILDSVDAALAELEDASFAGVRAVVDSTTADAGRNPAATFWVAQRVPVHIVVATGYGPHRSATPLVGDRTANEIAAIGIAEIRNGIAGSPMRAGVFVTGSSSNEITEVERRVVLAAAIAHRETGVPISIRPERGTMALEQLALLRDAGVAPDRVIAGCLDSALDETYLMRVLETGAFVAFDQVSDETIVSDRARAAMLRRLASAGHLGQLLVSGGMARKSSWLAYGGQPGLRYLMESFPVMLMDAGFAATEVRQIMVDNPQRALAIQP